MCYTILIIEKNSVARLIGRKGCRIKSIQQITRSGIVLLDGDAADTQKVKIVGPDDARILASNMIEKVVGKILKSEVHMEKLPGKRINKRRQRQRPSLSFDEMSSNVETLEGINSNVEMLNTITVKNERKDYKLMPPIKKNFYVEHREINAMSVEEVKTFRLVRNNIIVEHVEDNAKFQAIPKPIITFIHAFLPYPEIMNVIIKQSFRKPSPVQRQAWPIIMSGHDLIAISPKGTGKTLAYVLPALINLLQQPTPRKFRAGPSVAIISPTRNLVLEIEQEINKYIFAGIKVMSICDDIDVEVEINNLKRKKPEIIIATPSRLKDLISIMAIQLDHVSYLVFDEADRMLSMGFGIQVEIILKSMRCDKQTIFTSATWPIGILRLANYFNTNLLQITIDPNYLFTSNILKQKVIILKEYEKRSWLENFIKKNMLKNDKVLVFMHTKTNEFFKKLKNENIDFRFIYSGKILKDQETLNDVHKGVLSIVIAVDVKSWEIDIQDISLVINYDFPLNIDEYVSRLGIIGKACKTVSTISLFTENNEMNRISLINVLKKSKQPVPEGLLPLTLNNQLI